MNCIYHVFEVCYSLCRNMLLNTIFNILELKCSQGGSCRLVFCVPVRLRVCRDYIFMCTHQAHAHLGMLRCVCIFSCTREYTFAWAYCKFVCLGVLVCLLNKCGRLAIQFVVGPRTWSLLYVSIHIHTYTYIMCVHIYIYIYIHTYVYWNPHDILNEMGILVIHTC